MAAEEIALRPIYPARKSSLFHIQKDLFIDLTYHVLASSVEVSMVMMPLAPWTFGEREIARHTLQMTGHTSGKEGRLSIDELKSGWELVCREARI
jgi:hypothetical protein